MLRTVLQYCKREKLIDKGDYVLAGVSGGADSVCMLHLLMRLQKELGFDLEAVHVEHGIRGEESEQDALFVERLCREFQVPLQVYRVQAVSYAKEQKIGLEEAARMLRYDCYKKAADKTPKGNVKVALAHHADDNAETILFQMIRGSGIDGMSGMRPKRELIPGVAVIRPLLTVTRAQIEQYIETENLRYCVDSTNTDTTYSRNKIRCHILPMLEEVNTRAVLHINQSAERLKELGEYIKEQVEDAAKHVLKERETGIIIQEKEYEKLPEFLKKELLHFAIEQAAGSGKDIGLSHVALLAGLFELQTGRNISLPYQLRAKRIYEGVILENKTWSQKEQAGEVFLQELPEPGFEEALQRETVIIDIPEGKMSFSLFEYTGQNAEISKNTYTKDFDYDKIKGSFQVRSRQAGDYLIVDGDGHKKRLKEYFINEKVPLDKRDDILLLTQGSRVLWVIGGRISADTKITKNTKRILRVQVSGGNYYED